MEQNRFMRRSLRKFMVSMAVALSIGLVASAQNPDDPGGGVDDVPVDGGITLLVAAGVGYGIKRYRDEKRKVNEP